MNKNIVELYTLELDGTYVFAGADLDTRKINYYREQDGIIFPVNEELYQQAIQFKEQSSNIPNPDFKAMLDRVIERCKIYNNEKGYSNTTLERNMNNLSISGQKSSLDQSQAFYDTFNNSFSFELPENYWELSGIMGILMQRSMNQIISHEVGHMSVSDIQIESNMFIGSIGFLQMKIPIKSSMQTSDGNNYYRIDKEQKIKENGGRGLEELFNELENDEKTNSRIAPNFAFELDKLTEGKLHLARRNHSLAEYFMVMESIIPNRENSLVLIMQIELYYEAVGSQNEQSIKTLESEISKTLLDYEIRKRSAQSCSQRIGGRQ
jgi:hypothetical protein